MLPKKSKENDATGKTVQPTLSYRETSNEAISASKPMKVTEKKTNPGLSRIQETEVVNMQKRSVKNNFTGKNVKSISFNEPYNKTNESKFQVTSVVKPLNQPEIAFLEPCIPPETTKAFVPLGEKKASKKSKKKIAAGKNIQYLPSSREPCNETSDSKVQVTSVSKQLEIPTLDPSISSRVPETCVLPGEKMSKKARKKHAAAKIIQLLPFPSEPRNEPNESIGQVKSVLKPLKQTKPVTSKPYVPECLMPPAKKYSKNININSVAGKNIWQTQSDEKKSEKINKSSNRFRELADLTIFEPFILDDKLVTKEEKDNLFDLNRLIKTDGTKYNLLYKAMISKLENLGKGYECLQTFRAAEMFEKSKGSPACTKGFCIGKVMFVMRKQFNKVPAGDAITPTRFASIVSLVADRVFREVLVSDPSAMKTAFETVTNPFGKVHGFSVKSVPETDDQKKLFYYYLVTTISMNALMQVNPISCLAIAKWRLYDNHFKRLGLHNKAVDIDETYARCLSNIKATTQYVINSKSCSFHFKAEDIIDNQTVLKKMMDEFSFLKKHAERPCVKRFQFCK